MPEAFALLVLPDATLTADGSTESGFLALECVTVSHPGGVSAQDRDVYLVLRVNTTETPLDPDRTVQRSDSPGYRSYMFRGTPIDPTDLTLSFKLPLPEGSNPAYLEDLETFESIIGQYHTELRGGSQPPPVSASTSKPFGNVAIGAMTQNEKELRGHLVVVDEKSGQVVGQVEDRFRIREDPVMHTSGHENDPVVIEVAGQADADFDTRALEAFARIVPPDQQNWITSTATVVSSAISLTTNLVVTTITAASNFYINRSAPSPHHSRAGTPPGGEDGSSRGTPPPIPPRPRALVFLTSERTKKGLSTVHAISGEAVKVSAKTVGFIDSLIRRAMGANPKRDRTAFLRVGQASPGTISASPTSSATSPKSRLSPLSLPSRRATSPAPSAPPPPPLPPRGNLSNKDRFIVSADLILSTIDHSARRLLDSSTHQVGKVMEHKYGSEAAESSMLMANTARNVGLVYIDMRGIGRRALLRSAGRQYVKSQFSSMAAEGVPEQGGASLSSNPFPPKQ